MSKSEVLYLKYRPSSFDEVLGQDQIVRTLKNSLDTNSVGHAYLFSGERGTGKTTMARIFARALGCTDNDIIEIDAASNRGIDDIRAVRDAVYTLPFDSKYKVYIIDEVHMLTKEAFNALLKTIEEPPQHVVFVLATTELHKVLPTVVSRCQSFVFHGPDTAELSKMVSSISSAEGRSISTAAANLIARLGKGSYRDTQTVLQKVLSASSADIDLSEVELISGSPSLDVLISLVDSLNTNNSESGLDTLSKAAASNINPAMLLSSLIDLVRTILLVRFSQARSMELEQSLDADYFKRLKEFASAKNNINSKLLKNLLISQKYLAYTEHKYLAIELAFFDDLSNNG